MTKPIGISIIFQIVAIAAIAPSAMNAAESFPAIPRKLPPQGKKLEDDIRGDLEHRLNRVQERLARHSDHALAPDIEIFTGAVELALKFGEFYAEQDVKRAIELLDTASKRLDALEAGKAPWVEDRGLIVRGYRSSVDGSVQPYGLVIPEKLDRSKPVPLYVWLHGRGDQSTNLHFLHQRQTQVGNIAPPNAIVIHPWGRHCLGYKSAGEIDVLEATDHVMTQYKIDSRRVVLMGFSMGGAGCWHVGAHYSDRWVAMSPGAGFAETARYQHIDPQSVPWYERTLWGVYDVPDYVRNLFNLPVIAYSGENDKQIQAARMMEEAFAVEGKKLRHLIGPGVEHKYHPETLAELLKELDRHCERGLDTDPRTVSLQTRTLRYHKVHWADVQRLEEHWQDTRVDAERTADDKLQLTTRNVASLMLSPTKLPQQVKISIDGQKLPVAPNRDERTKQAVIRLVKREGKWEQQHSDAAAAGSPIKRPGLQGPIDDAFLDPFLVVLPSGKCRHPAVQQWVDFESGRFLDRWVGLYRGAPRVKRDYEVTAEDLSRYHLLLWGDPSANQVLTRVASRLPIQWTENAIMVGAERYPAAGHVPVMIFPNPESPGKYIVLNSGPTFREDHDRTNSLQNPKLPDWAIFDLSQPPNGTSAGRVVAADFFDERWQLRAKR